MPEPLMPPYNLQAPTPEMVSLVRQTNANFEDLYQLWSGTSARATGITTPDDVLVMSLAFSQIGGCCG